MTNEQIEEASRQHFYWFAKAVTALDKMRELALDMTQQHTDAFAKAQQEFKEASGRCKVEFEIMQKGMIAQIEQQLAKDDPIQRLLDGGGEGGSTDCLFDDESNDEEVS